MEPQPFWPASARVADVLGFAMVPKNKHGDVRQVRLFAAAALMLLTGAVIASAQDANSYPDEPKAAAPRKPAAPPAKPDVIVDKLATPTEPLANVPAREREAVRSALLWQSSDEAVPAGEDPIVFAIKNYQKRTKGKISGTLTDAEREALLAEAKAREDEFGWRVVTDPATGMRVGLPTKMVPQANDAPQGTRWSSRHGDVQVETFRIKTAEGIAALFEQAKKEAARKVEYSLMRGDNYVVSGLQGLKKFATRAYMRNGELRGVTVSYDQAIEGIVAPLAVVMASAFSPFPDRVAPMANLSKSVDYGTGLVVSADGHLVTDRKLTEGCISLVAAGIGSAERVAVDPQNALALLRVYGRGNLKPVTFATPAAKPTEDVLVLGIPDPHIQNGEKAPAELRARLRDGGGLELRAPLPMAGYSGAAALSKSGEVLGMIETRNTMLASAEPSLPPVRLIPADTIRDFMTRNGIPQPVGGGDVRASVVRIICVRK